MKHLAVYGGVPVPYTVAWTAEDADWRVAVCPHAAVAAICQRVAPGVGKPTFGKPHSQRQRETIIGGLCDLCGRPLKGRTRVSLSHARPQLHGAEGLAVLQVEPLLHRGCAAVSMRHCPSLKRDVARGMLMVRQVLRSRVQVSLIAPEFVSVYVPGYVGSAKERVAGHAKVELLDWKDRDAEWLVRCAS